MGSDKNDFTAWRTLLWRFRVGVACLSSALLTMTISLSLVFVCLFVCLFCFVFGQAKLEKMLGRNARFGSSNKRRRRTPVPSVGRTKAQLAHLEAFRAELRSQKRASLVEEYAFLCVGGLAF